jgi:hypothetical protein
MGFLDRALGIDRRASEIEKRVELKVATELEKASQGITKQLDHYFTDTMAKADNVSSSTGMIRYQYDTKSNNSRLNNKSKPGSSVPFDVLRRFSVQHDITRACINTRKRQMNQLEWEIVAAEDDQKEISPDTTRKIKEQIKHLGGRTNNYKKLVDKMIEDLLVLDAVAIEKQRTRGGDLLGLVPIDATTIRIIVAEDGSIPEPPDIAYKQIIRGQVTAELTADEMIYEMMNPRSNTPYGLAPMESLIVAISSSLKAALYNMGYLTDGNIPEGLFGVPEAWTPQMIKGFQENWDAAMAGNEIATSRLKFVPSGKGSAGYTPTKKPTDMMWESFNDWLLHVTCSIFDVQPIEIGFHPKTGLGGKGFSEGQELITNRRAVLPLAHFLEDIFTQIIQIDLGYPDYRFSFKGLIENDVLGMATANEILIRSGQRTVDELRTDEGLKPLGIDKPFVLGTPTFIDEESMAEAAQQKADAAAAQAAALSQANDAVDKPEDKTPPKEDAPVDNTTKATDPGELHVALVSEMRTFRKYAIDRKKNGRTLRPFTSDVLPEDVVSEMNKRVAEAPDVDAVRSIFKEYMEDYQVSFLADVIQLKESLNKVL